MTSIFEEARHELDSAIAEVFGDKRVKLEGSVFTVDFETTNAYGGKPGVLYYGFAERPGELFEASRCEPYGEAR